MGGRNGKPVDLLMAVGKKHLTKEEIEFRKNNEIKLGNGNFKCPSHIKSDKISYKKWKEIIAIYQNADFKTDFVSSADVGILGMYCKTFSEYCDLIERRKRISKIHDNSDDLEKYIEDTDEFNVRVKHQLMDMISTDALIRLDAAINKKMDMLIKMEDRLFLNPLAKVKNVPKKEEEEPENQYTRFSR